MRYRKSILLGLAAFHLTANAAATEGPKRPFLTLEAAKEGAIACENFARENNLRVAISVKDRAGNTVYFQRMDDVFQKQIELAGIKAETAATTPLSTKRVAEVASESGPLSGLVYLPGVTKIEGGEPIRTTDGYSVGGVGVSGATPAQDGACARKAALAIQQQIG